MLRKEKQSARIVRTISYFLVLYFWLQWPMGQTGPVAFGAPEGAANVQQPSAEADMTIRSDTQGYDFGPYVNKAVNSIRSNWYAVMPPAALQGAKGRAVVMFTIPRDGSVKEPKVTSTSGKVWLDNAATAAIRLSSPFTELPAGFKGDHIDVQLTFTYNMK